MKRGPKGTTDRTRLLRGTFKPCRASGPPAVPPLVGVPRRPAWLTGDARRRWDDKTATYLRRAQAVIGCEGPLAVYCRLEAEIVKTWRAGGEVSSAVLTAYRGYAAEFYDTPASQRAARATAGGANPFAAHGRPPAARA